MMSTTPMTMELYQELEEKEVEESAEMASFNHGYIQARLVILLNAIGDYTPVSELSLDIGGIDLQQLNIKTKEEMKPDICLYPKRGLSRPTDILRMAEMPLLAVEILSPKQGTYDILEKFKAYFALGIRSCWLVDPAISVITVYASMDRWQPFSSGEVVDDVLNIRLSMNEIFS